MRSNGPNNAQEAARRRVDWGVNVYPFTGIPASAVIAPAFTPGWLIARGVSPWETMIDFLQSRKAATEATAAPSGLCNDNRLGFQGSTPLATNGRRSAAQILSYTQVVRPSLGVITEQVAQFVVVQASRLPEILQARRLHHKQRSVNLFFYSA